jgi:hypothetical protein
MTGRGPPWLVCIRRGCAQKGILSVYGISITISFNFITRRVDTVTSGLATRS